MLPKMDIETEVLAQTIEARAALRGTNASVAFSHPTRPGFWICVGPDLNAPGKWLSSAAVPVWGVSQIRVRSRLEGIRWALQEGFEEDVPLDDLPVELRNLIRHLLATLPEKHGLDAAERQAIYASMGPWERRGIGHRRRIRLAMRSAKRVLPLVERLLPGSWSRVLLLLAQQILEGKQDTAYLALLWYSQRKAWLDEDPRAFQDMLAFYQPIGSRGTEETLVTVEQVAHAAERAVEVALFDEFDTQKLLEAHPDTTPDYWSDDAAAWAWLAEREKDDPATQLANGDAFWVWWLGIAAPQAWASEL